MPHLIDIGRIENNKFKLQTTKLPTFNKMKKKASFSYFSTYK